MKKGELQVGEKEREQDLSSVRREIATLVAEKCVDPATQRPYPVGVIDKAMTEAGFSVKPGKNAKSQVSECIKLLQTDSKLPIQRARMRIKVSVPKVDAEKVKGRVLESAETVEKDDEGGEEWEAVSHTLSTFVVELMLSSCRRYSLTQASSGSSASYSRKSARAEGGWRPLPSLRRREVEWWMQF